MTQVILAQGGGWRSGWAYSPLANVQPVRMDAALDEITMPTEIVAAIAAIPDVVEHGLFLNGIDTIVIARGDTMEVRRRGQARSR